MLVRDPGGQIYPGNAGSGTSGEPREFLEADLAKEDYVDLLDDEFLHGLSHKYGVSMQALVNRLKNLG